MNKHFIRIFLALGEMAMACPAPLAANSADSSNITVDTRDLTIGTLVITGPANIVPFQNTQCTALLDGVDVSSRCSWPQPKSSRVFDGWYQYPSFNAVGLLDPNASQPGDTIQISATFAEPGGDTRTASKIVTIGTGSGLYFGINQNVVYQGPAGAQFEWNVSVSAGGLAAKQPGVTFTWFLDGILKGTGKTLSWTTTSRPGTRMLRLTASDGQGNSGEQSASLVFPAPSPGEPGQRWDVWRKKGVSLTNENGEPATPDPAKKPNGLIVVSHGLRSSPYHSWIQNMAGGIKNRLSGSSQPNVLVFGWESAANPGSLQGTAAERLEVVASSLGFSESTVRKVFPSSTAAVDYLVDILTVRSAAEDEGRKLAEWIQKEESLGNVSKTARIHLIGHSAGGFVMGECYVQLRAKGFNVQRVTMLDTPMLEPRHVAAGDPAVIERYVSSAFGYYCPGIDMFGALPAPPWTVPINLKPDSTWYRRFDIGSWRYRINQLDAHSASHEWYSGTVISSTPLEGFQLSPFITGAAPIPPPAPAPPNPGPQDDGPQPTPLPPATIDGFSTFGTVTGGGSPYTLTENSNAGLKKAMTLSPDADRLTFEYQFTSPGDGDYLVVFFGDSPPLFVASPTDSNTNGPATAEISLKPHAGQTGDLVIKLVAQDAADAVVTVGNILLTLDDDLDGDGITGANEIAAGTDPRFADTDGDGLDDPTELNITGTSPVLPDSDGDGADDGDEVAAGTNPSDVSSKFAVKSSVKAAANFTIFWSSVAGKTYRIIRSDDPGFASFDVIAAGITASPPEQFHVDSGGATPSRRFYRVELE